MRKEKISGKKRKNRIKDNLWGWFFVLPACMGLMIYIILPMIYSFAISFCEWDFISDPVFVGIKNYKRLLTTDVQFWNTCKVTVKYTLIYVPAMMIWTFFLALLLNAKHLKAKGFWRVVVYLPSMVPMVASAVLWTYIYDPSNGVLNTILSPIGIRSEWIFGKTTVLPCIAVMTIWGAGSTVMINLSGLRSVQQELYEAVAIDGGGGMAKLLYVTIPMMTPMIFYNLVMAVIASLQTFTQGYVMTEGGPQNASNFYMLYLYNNAFKFNRMGLACAQSWVLFVVIGVITLILFRTSGWVYYAGDE